MKQSTLNIKRKPDPVLFVPASWVPAIGEHNIRADHFINALKAVRAAGLHPMRATVITKPAQGYQLMVAQGGYRTIKEQAAMPQQNQEQELFGV